MRILAISDLHGYSTALDALIAAVNPKLEDLIITLGDYVDRGPDSKGVIDRLIALYQTGQLIPLRGNHELMMLASRKKPKSRWRRLHGKQTLASYAKSGKSKLSNIPEEHWDFIENTCVNYWETEKHFFVHANACPYLPLEEQPEQMLFWEKFNNPPPHFSGKIMVCGHTSQKSGKPLNIGHAVCIDTRIHSKGWVTCLDVTTGRIWQANRKGQVRTGWIYDFAAEAIAL